VTSTGTGSDAAVVTIRPMCAADIDQVLEIAAGLKDAPHWQRDAYTAALDQASMPRRIALVATNEPLEGGVVGFAVASLLPPQAELESIAVRKDAQRLGVGSLLLGRLGAELRAAEVTEFLLEVRASNAAGLAFYQSSGWSMAGVRPRYYADPEEDAILMSRDLSQSV
jgi:ribosomal-protein-alanine N-acetyltransferase